MCADDYSNYMIKERINLNIFPSRKLIHTYIKRVKMQLCWERIFREQKAVGYLYHIADPHSQGLVISGEEKNKEFWSQEW